MNAQDFFANYDLWISDCHGELLDKGYTTGDVSSFDICEDGSVYMGNLTFTGKGFVTPWLKSEYYIN